MPQSSSENKRKGIDRAMIDSPLFQLMFLLPAAIIGLAIVFYFFYGPMIERCVALFESKESANTSGIEGKQS